MSPHRPAAYAARPRILLTLLLLAGLATASPPAAAEAPGLAPRLVSAGPAIPIGPGSAPSLAPDDDGGAWLAFAYDGFDFDRGIYLQRLNRVGEPVGSRIQIAEAGADLSVNAPDIAQLANGGYAVVWQEDIFLDPFEIKVWGRLSGPDGQPLGNRFPISQQVGQAGAAEVIATPDGGFAVTWIEPQMDDVNLSRVALGLYDQNAQPTGPRVLVDDPGFIEFSGPDLAIDPVDDQLEVIWVEGCGDDPCTSRVRTRRFDAQLNPLTDPLQLGFDGLAAVAVQAIQAAGIQAFWIALDEDQAGPSGGPYTVEGILLTDQGAVDDRPPRPGLEPFTYRFGVRMAAAVGPLGTTAVVWPAPPVEGMERELMFQGLDVGGQPLPGAVALPATVGESISEVAVAPVGDGGFILVSSEPLLAGGIALVARRVALPDGGCVADADTLCLRNGRFRVSVLYDAPVANELRPARAVPLSNGSGAFWFFRESNIEMGVKLLDGTAFTGHFWFFIGTMSNVYFEVLVEDTVSGQSKRYVNQAGNLKSRGDLMALPAVAGIDTAAPAPGSAAAAGSQQAALPPSGGGWRFLPEGADRPLSAPRQEGSCEPSETVLCLFDDRFQIEMEFDHPNNGETLPAKALPPTPVSVVGQSGSFYFFNPGSLELVVKVIDGRGIDGHFWLFYGSLSNLAFRMTVTDTVSGASRVYENRAGRFRGGVDTTTF